MIYDYTSTSFICLFFFILFFWLANFNYQDILKVGSSALQCVSEAPSWLSLTVWLAGYCMPVAHKFIHSSTMEPLGAAILLMGMMLLWAWIFKYLFEFISFQSHPKGGCLDWYCNYMLDFLECHHKISSCNCTILDPTNNINASNFTSSPAFIS